MAIQQKSVPYTFPNGIKTKLYTIGSLASALGRSSATVRKWEISGILPKTPFKSSAGRRLYTQEQIGAVVAVAETVKIGQGKDMHKSDFGRKCEKEFNKLNEKYMTYAEAKEDESEEIVEE